LGALFDIVPFRLSGVYNNGFKFFDLNVWAVIVIGVMGSVLSVYSFSLYPLMADKYLKTSKNEDIKF
jgi:TctA family transporter